MRALQEESSVEVLRMFSQWLIDENAKLRKTIEEASLQKEAEKQSKLNIEDQLLVFRRMLFKRGREKRAEASDRPRDQEENDLLIHSRSLLPPLKNNQTKKIDEVVQVYEMSEEELVEEARLRGILHPTSDDWKKLEGFYDESSEVEVIERKYQKVIHRRQKYKLVRDDLRDKEVIVTAPGPEKLLEGSSYSIGFATSVVADKYIYHMPLERQCRQMEASGLKGMSPKTLYNLCLATSVHLEEVAQRIKNEILSCKLCVHVDESPWPINSSKQDDGYMWVVSNQAGSFYQFENTRAGLVAKELLKDFHGVVLTDGYRGYNQLEKVEGLRLANCWAHVRRKFFEIEPNYPTECKEILDQIDELFEIDRQAKSFEELKTIRQTKSQVVLDRIFEWLTTQHTLHRAESGMRKAIEYTLKLWRGLSLFIEDVRAPLTNNNVERAIRHAVMGRKNFYGSRTINGADVAATLYTIIESCKKVELDPKSFIEMAVQMRAQGKNPPTPLEHARQLRT